MVNWHQVPTKDEIWNYVKTKYMIAEEGKGYVLKSVADLWRNYKCRVKNKHYSPYTNQTDRWNNRPNSIPEDHFAELLKYWDLEAVQNYMQEMSKKKKESIEAQRNRPTLGPVSFSRKRSELEQAGKMSVTEATMYKETHRRKEGKEYITSKQLFGNDTEVLIQRHGRLRCTKRVKGASNNAGMVVPDEFLQPIKTEAIKILSTGF